MQRLEDSARTLMFFMRASRRRRWKHELASTDSPLEILSIATAAFGSNQNGAEILGLINRLKAEEPQVVCEIGVADGGTNFLFTHAFPKIEFMLGIDLFVRGKARLRYFARTEQHLLYFDGSSRSPDMVAQVNAALSGRKLDLLFIDGDHAYAGARADFLNYRQFVREGGTIAFHDICPDLLTRFGRPTGNLAGDVPVLWQKLKKSFPHEEFVENRDQDGFGIGAIRHSSTVPMPADL